MTRYSDETFNCTGIHLLEDHVCEQLILNVGSKSQRTQGIINLLKWHSNGRESLETTKEWSKGLD